MIYWRFLFCILITFYGCGIGSVNDPYEQGLTYDPGKTVLIPAGAFVMGSNSWSDSEQPSHTVFLIASIYFCKIEKVTVAPRKILK